MYLMDDSKQHFDFLMKGIRDYIPLSEWEEDYIKQLFVLETFKRNEAILKEGEVCRKFYFVAQGIVRFSQFSFGEERTYVFRPEGSFCNDLESFLCNTPSKNNIYSVDKTYILSITYDNLQLLYKNVSHGDRFGRLAIEKVFVMVVSHLTSFYSKTPEERFVDFTKKHPELLQRIPQHYIASYIGVTPQTLCRIKKNLYKKMN